jgi:hypothetical protein
MLVKAQSLLFLLLDRLRNLDLELLLRKFWVFRPNPCDCFFPCLFHLRVVALFDSAGLMKWTPAAAVMEVVITFDIHPANVALLITASGASDFVAAIGLDEGVLAIVATPNESLRLSFFHFMSGREPLIVPRLLATHRDVRLLVAESAAGSTTVRVLAAELAVDLHRLTIGFEVTEGAFCEIGACGPDVFLLLKALQTIE